MTFDSYEFETGIYRPPSEGGSASLLLRFTRNCPWNHCTFCSMYKGEKFQLRPLSEIKADIDAIAALVNDLKTLSAASGSKDPICGKGLDALLARNPSLNFHPGFAMVVDWVAAGGRTAFIQDANSLIMKTSDLVQALVYLKKSFPTLGRITTYARARTLVQKPADDLAAICKAGLDRLHLGLETGDDHLLKEIKKGITPEGHIMAGQKAMAAGFQVSEYWMPGLGGKEHTRNHALETARVLNAINPHYIRSRPFRAIPGTPSYDLVGSGKMVLLSPQEELQELKTMVQALELNSRVCFDHAGNYWKRPGGGLVFSHDYEGYKFPEEKPEVLSLIQEGLAIAQKPSRFLHM